MVYAASVTDMVYTTSVVYCCQGEYSTFVVLLCLVSKKLSSPVFLAVKHYVVYYEVRGYNDYSIIIIQQI